MIISEKFVWAHVPKTGGDATAEMVRQVPRLFTWIDPARDNAKHLAFDQRRGSIRGKLLVANIRRLDAWAVSLSRHRERSGSYPDERPEGRRSPDLVASESAGEALLDEIIGNHEVDVWLRQEHLADDLVRFLREISGLTPSEEAAVRSVGRVNEQRSRLRFLGRSPKRFFNATQLERLYANNPRWAAIEQRVYG